MVGPILRRGWSGAEDWRGTTLGMWAWLLQRAAAVGLVVVIGLHVASPFRWELQAVLLALALVHGLLGVRSLLLDLGVPLRCQRALFVAAIVLGALVFAAVWAWRWA